jgi:hypothetical protein
MAKIDPIERMSGIGRDAGFHMAGYRQARLEQFIFANY